MVALASLTALAYKFRMRNIYILQSKNCGDYSRDHIMSFLVNMKTPFGMPNGTPYKSIILLIEDYSVCNKTVFVCIYSM